MRIKDIPEEAAETVAKYPLAFAIGAAVLIAGGAFYYSNRDPVAANDLDVAANNPIPFTWSVPQLMPNLGGGIGSVDSATNIEALDPTGGTGGTQLDWALLEFAQLKQQNEYSLARQTLNAQMSLAQINASIAEQGIQAQNWQTSASIAQQFLLSGQQFFAGSIGGQTFGFLGSGMPYTGSNKKTMTQLQQSNLQNLMGSSFVQGLFNGTFGSTGTSTNSPYGSTGATASLFTGGGATTTAALSSSSSRRKRTTTSSGSTSTFQSGSSSFNIGSLALA